MQPTDTQVQRSLAALRDDDGHELRDPRVLFAPDGGLTTGELPIGLVERLERAPSVRADRLAEARHRLEVGDQPTADDLANRMVGRLVCDRLR